MTSPAALLFAAALVFSGPARASSALADYDAKSAPLDDLCKEMLTSNCYEIRDDGKVWDKIGESAVAQTDMPYLLSRLASAKRLRALLQINNIITRYDAERKLTEEDKEAVRILARQAWVVFGNVPRNDFRSYFSIEERESLDKIAPRFESMGTITMTDPSTDWVTEIPPSMTARMPAKAAAASPSVTALPPAAVAAPSVTALPPVAAAAPAVAPPPPAPPIVPAAPVAPVVPAIAGVVPPAPTVVADVPAAPAPAVVPVPVAPPPAPQPLAVVAPAAVAVAAAPARIIPTLTPMMDMPSLKRASPFAPAAPAAAPAAPPPAPAQITLAPAPVPVAPVPAPVAPAAVPAAPTPPPAAPAAVVMAPAVVPPVPAAPVTYKAEPAVPSKLAEVYAPPPAPTTAAVVANDLGTLKAWTPPAAFAPPAAAPPKPAAVAISTPAAPAAPSAPEPPKAAVVGETEYAKFVAEGPYNSGGKAVLELIGKRAPDFCLPLLRRTVVGLIPQIVSDGARTGAELRAGYTRDAANPLAPPVVALSPGPLFVVVKKSMFASREAVLLPESPQAWIDLGVARPTFDALRANAEPVSTENGDWGAVRVYADGSRRGSYSTMEMAGELLEQLLLLGLSREGLDASTYAARRWARTSRLMFYARLKDETQQDNFLDPDRREELRGWLDHPDETDDVAAAVWSGSRRQLLDPRRGPPAAALEFETRARATCVRSALEDALSESSRRRAARVGGLASLLDAGIVDAAAAKSAASAATQVEEAERLRLVAMPPACPAADAAHAEGLRKAVLLLAESARAERLMREQKAGIASHAL